MANTNYTIPSYYVYRLRLSRSREPFYVGKGKGNRAFAHFTEWSLSVNSHKTNVIKAARDSGRDIWIEFMHENLTNAEACELERHYIAKWGRRDLGTGCLTNKTDGGEGSEGLICTEETRRKMSLARQGMTSPMLGKTHASTTKQRMREVHLGRLHTEESKQRISKSQSGHSRKHSEETRAKMSQTRTGKKLAPFSDEHRAKLSAAKKGKTQSLEHRQRVSAAIAEVWRLRKLAAGATP